MKTHFRLPLVLFLSFLSLLGCISRNQDLTAKSGFECKRWVDEQGVVHIKATETLQVIQCMGKEHAVSRPFQLSYFRRTTAGERSEIYGAQELKTDYFMRLLNLRGIAKRLANELSPGTRAWLEAYSRGVNQGLQDPAAQEDALLKSSPENLDFQWSIEDTLALILLQSFDQTRKTFETEFKEQKWAEFHGEDQAKKWFSLTHLPWETPILKQGEYVPRDENRHPTRSKTDQREASLHLKNVGLLSRFQLPDFDSTAESMGSNNWALSSARTQSGRVWVANDPHLSLTHPSFWQWIHLEGGDLDAIGVAFPGIPLIVSGSNRSVSWGLTNSYMNTGDAPWVNAKDLISVARREFPWVWVKVGPIRLPVFFKALFRTPGGYPILPIGSAKPGFRHVLKWSGFELRGNDFESFFKMMGVRNSFEMDDLASRMGVPSWNLVFGDREGNIGFRVLGKIPRTREHLPFGHSVATLKEVEIPFESLAVDEIPHLLNPKRGFVVTANQRHWEDSSSEFQSGQGYAFGFRGHRIEELLLGGDPRTSPRHTLETQRQIQCDVQAVDARYLLPLLMDFIRTRIPSEIDSARSSLRVVWTSFLEWEKKDYAASLECRACGPFRRWMERIFEREGLDERGLYRWLTQEDRLLTPVRAKDWLSELNAALDDFGIASGVTEVSQLPAWREIHQNPFRSIAAPHLPSGRSPGLPSAGDDHSVSPGTSDWDPAKKSYTQLAGASHRLLVHLTDIPEVYGILPDTTWNPALQRYQDCQLERRHFPLDWNDPGIRSQVSTWTM